MSMSLLPGGRSGSQVVVPLDPVQRDVVCTILQDCVDQLSILGAIIPNYADKPSALDAVSLLSKRTTPPPWFFLGLPLVGLHSCEPPPPPSIIALLILVCIVYTQVFAWGSIASPPFKFLATGLRSCIKKQGWFGQIWVVRP